MPLTAIQQSVAEVLRSHRSERSYVAGGAALNREWPRLSDDMDIFLDDRDRLPHSVEPELQALRNAGYAVELTNDNDLVVEAVLKKGGEETLVQWFDDEETCRRFFPAQDDPQFGFRLHEADLAVNKVLCAARRTSAARDAVDLVNIVERYAPLGPLVWAVSGKAPDMAPPSTLRAIRANAFGYAEEEVDTVRMEDGSGCNGGVYGKSSTRHWRLPRTTARAPPPWNISAACSSMHVNGLSRPMTPRSPTARLSS